jgi:hypothetical protein
MRENEHSKSKIIPTTSWLSIIRNNADRDTDRLIAQ